MAIFGCQVQSSVLREEEKVKSDMKIFDIWILNAVSNAGSFFFASSATIFKYNETIDTLFQKSTIKMSVTEYCCDFKNNLYLQGWRNTERFRH